MKKAKLKRKPLKEELKRAKEELEEQVRKRTEEVIVERQRLYDVLDYKGGLKEWQETGRRSVKIQKLARHI